MKKFISVILFAVICLCLVLAAGCGKKDGCWALKRIEGTGATTEEEIDAMEELMGGIIYLWLKPDKTAEFNIIAGANAGTYDSKVIFIDDSEMSYKVKGDTLYLYVDEDNTMIFERTTEAAVQGNGG